MRVGRPFRIVMNQFRQPKAEIGVRGDQNRFRSQPCGRTLMRVMVSLKKAEYITLTAVVTLTPDPTWRRRTRMARPRPAGRQLQGEEQEEGEESISSGCQLDDI